MPSGATAITVFHSPADPTGFDAWVSELRESARASAGYAGSRVSVHSDARLDWAVEVRFDTTDLLDKWLDSAARAAVLKDGESLGFWRSTSDLVMAEHNPPRAGVAVFTHKVASGKEADFVAAQANIAAGTATFPGNEGTVLFPSDSSGEWTAVLRFRTENQLAAWLRSSEREDALPALQANLTRDFSELSRAAPFGSTVRIEGGQARITPGWKTAMLVLLCLYPIVMLLSKFLSPVLADLGVGRWLAVFISCVISVALLQWILVPGASRPVGRWLDPVDGAGLRISLSGAAIVAVGYAVTLAIFASISWLQF